MATMTATTMTMKTKATMSLMAARRWQWHRAGSGKGVAEAGSAINIFQTEFFCCYIECCNLEEPIQVTQPTPN
jgi:hypothetical protein